MLVALVFVPILVGTLRMVEVFGGPHVLPPNPRVDASPVPVVVHILSVSLYAVLGAFQFSAGLRSRRPGWHRRVGRALVASGLIVASSGLWMTLLYPRPEGTGDLLYLFRLAAGSAMAASIILGFAAIRRRDVARHRAWMTRAYAIALGAGTQVFTQGFGETILGDGAVTNALLAGAGWAINLVVAECVIRRTPDRRRRGPRRATAWPGAA
jgi:uncharacterized membrane protein